MASAAQPKESRRDFLRKIAPSAVGLNFAGLMHARATASAGQHAARLPGRVKSCILVFYYGGPSHLDTLDMKPDGPSAIRGEFKPISTAVPGIHICEHMPHLARVMDKVTVIRSMRHSNRLHDSASTVVLLGKEPPNGDVENFAPIPQFHPCYGSALSYLRQDQNLDISHAALPHMIHNVVDVPCQGGGFLGAAYDPFRFTCDPVKHIYSSKMLDRPAALTVDRIAGRRALLSQLDGPLGNQHVSTELESLYSKAYDLLESKALAQAMDIEQEDTATRDRYGWSEPPSPGGGTGSEKGVSRNMRGQNLLMARRLVEAGVPFVNVNDFHQQGQNWDTHAENFKQIKDVLLPVAEQSLAALIEDLDERGLLDTTLVIAMGEFGRTPKINGNAGRDHWPDCYSILLAGGGIKGGYLHGASDSMGARVDLDPVSPGDLAATIFWAFGIDPETLIHDRSDRPHPIARGKPVVALFASTP